MGHGGRSPRRPSRVQEEQGQGCHRRCAGDLAALSRSQPGNVEAEGEGWILFFCLLVVHADDF